MNKKSLTAIEVAFPAALLGAIWFWSLQSATYYFPPLPEVLRTFSEVWLFERVPGDLLPSLGRLTAGLGLGVLVGVTFGLVIGRVPVLARAFSPVIEFCRVLPPPAILPVFMLVVGLGNSAQISLIAFGTLWPILLSTIAGVRGIDPTMLDTARSYSIGELELMRGIVIPGAMPQILSGARTALSIGLILTVISEMIGSTNGVGYAVIRAQRQFAMPEMWAGIVLLGLLGYALNAVFEVIERRLLVWHRGARANV